ncbi:hypothetical protein D3C87_1758720 [compost metagenome]
MCRANKAAFTRRIRIDLRSLRTCLSRITVIGDGDGRIGKQYRRDMHDIAP